MLENNYQQQLEIHRGNARCLLVPPADWQQVKQQRGVIPSVYDERRRFVRRYCPVQSLLEVDQTIPAVQRAHEFHVIYVVDFSRGGVAFFHHAQLFPGEGPILWLPTGARACLVMRCTRRNAHCYEIGAKFDLQ